MKGVMFGGLRSDKDFGLVLYSKKISPPVVKTTTIDIPGRDGKLDITEALTGRVAYEDREISFVFRVPNPKEEWANIYSDVLNRLHGKRMEIVLDDDPDYFYAGRISIDEFATSRSLAEIGVKCIVAPKKTYKTPVSRTVAVSGTKTMEVTNNGLPTVPIITTDKEMDVSFGGVAYHILPGKNKIFDIFIPEGKSKLIFSGTGNVTVEYKVQSL